MSTTLPYGTWSSPISASDVAAGAHPVELARYVGGEIWWTERLPAEGARSALRRQTPEGAATLLPAPWDIRSRAHEYGGGAWAAGPSGAAFVVSKSDQRVWRVAPDTEPVALTNTPAPGVDVRFADLQHTPLGLLAVRESFVLGATGSPVHRDIVLIPLDGSAAEDATAIDSVVSGSDFVSAPRLSPDGSRLAWIAWDAPAMPWTASELRVGAVIDGAVTAWDVAAGGADESVVQPEWTGDDELTFASDRSGRWNLERLSHGERRAIAPADADTGGALWNFAQRWFAPLPDGRILAVRTHGTDSLAVIDPITGAVRPLPGDLSSRVLIQDVRGFRVLLTGSGPTTFGGLYEIDLAAADPRPVLVRGNVDSAPEPAWLPPARAVSFDGPHGLVHAFFYPPTHPEARAPEGELPPCLVLAHGGPTSHVSGEASLHVAYLTSRGIAVLDVNYGGSTGYGRAYRERLDGQWGIVDRDDVVAAATGLAESGEVDAGRLAIRGGSAGGWTVLCALTATDRFAAGISRYGVADLRALAEEPHGFEGRYLDGLVGPYPEAADLYAERSPLSRLEDFTTPMLLEQGTEDTVVPPAQSEAVRDALVAAGVPHAYLTFEGEGHGFRRTETVIRSLEAELGFLAQVLGFAPADVEPLALD